MRSAEWRRTSAGRGGGEPSRTSGSPRAGASRAKNAGALLGALLVLLALPAAGSAQDLQLSGFGGWRFGGSGLSPITYRNTDIDGARSFGGSASLRLWGRNAVEVYYSRAEGDGRRQFDDSEFEVAVSYLLVGVVHEVKTEGIRPFLGFAIGGARLRESPGGASTLFTAAGVAGVRVFLGRHVGLRGDGRLLFMSDDRGSSRSRELGGAGGFTIRGDSIIQAELTLGLVLAF